MLLVLQALQALGATAGLISAIYLGWQFVGRRVPPAVIVPRRPYELSPQLAHLIRIKNPADRPMIIRFEDNVGQNEIRIKFDDSIRSVVTGAVGRSVELILDADETREFPLARRADHEQIDPENQLFARFYWRYAQPFLLRIERQQTVQMSKRDYDALVANPLRPEEDD